MGQKLSTLSFGRKKDVDVSEATTKADPGWESSGITISFVDKLAARFRSFSYRSLLVRPENIGSEGKRKAKDARAERKENIIVEQNLLANERTEPDREERTMTLPPAPELVDTTIGKEVEVTVLKGDHPSKANPSRHDEDDRIEVLKKYMADMQTGDLLLVGSEGVYSKLIKVCTRSPWSHILMAIRLPTYMTHEIEHDTEDADIGDLMFCESVRSSNDGSVDMITMSRDKTGVRVVSATDVIRRDMHACIAKVVINLGKKEKLLGKKVFSLVSAMGSLPYEQMYTQLFNSVVHVKPLDGPEKARAESMFCSELVGTLLRELELVGTDFVPSYTTPSDYARGKIVFKKGVNYNFKDALMKWERNSMQ